MIKEIPVSISIQAVHTKDGTTVVEGGPSSINGVPQELHWFANQKSKTSERTLALAKSLTRRDMYEVRSAAIESQSPIVASYYFDDDKISTAGNVLKVGIVDQELRHRVGEFYQEGRKPLTALIYEPPMRGIYSKPEEDLQTKEAAVKAIGEALVDLLKTPGIVERPLDQGSFSQIVKHVFSNIQTVFGEHQAEKLAKMDGAEGFLARLAKECSQQYPVSFIQALAIFQNVHATEQIENMMSYSGGRVIEGTDAYGLTISLILDRLSELRDQVDGLPKEHALECIFTEKGVLYDFATRAEGKYPDVEANAMNPLAWGAPLDLGGGYMRTFTLDDVTKEITSTLSLDGIDIEAVHFPLVFNVTDSHEIATDLDGDFAQVGKLIPISIENPQFEAV